MFSGKIASFPLIIGQLWLLKKYLAVALIIAQLLASNYDEICNKADMPQWHLVVSSTLVNSFDKDSAC